MVSSNNATNMSRSSGCKIVYTDGGAHNNGVLKGLGAWAFVEYNPDNDIVNVHCGRMIEETTNNRAELMAVINAIRSYPQHSTLDVISDSGYVVKGYNHPSYLDKWVVNGWRVSTGAPVSNQELWRELLRLGHNYGFKLKLIKGHYKDPDPIHAYWNAIVDRACTHIMQHGITQDYVVLSYNKQTKLFEQKECAI